MTRVRVVSLRSFDPVIDDLSPRAFRAWQRALDFCDFHGTDGTLSPNNIKTIGASPAQQKELREAGLWEVDESGHTIVCELRYGPAVANVEGCEVDQLEDSRKPASIRQAAWRANRTTEPKRLHEPEKRLPETSTQPDETSTGPLMPPGSPQINPDLKSSPDPESSLTLSSSSDLTGSARVQRNRRRSALPADWKPSPEHIKRASENGLNLERESIRFRSHHEAKGSLMASWNAAFTTWLLNAVEFARPPGAVQHEKARQEEARRPYHELFKQEPAEPGLAPAEALAAIQRATAGIGRRIG